MKTRTWLSFLLVLTMLFACIPAGTFADGEDSEVVSTEGAPVVTEEKQEETAPAVDETALSEEPAPVVEQLEEKEEELAPAAEEASVPSTEDKAKETVEEPAPAVEEQTEDEAEESKSTVATEAEQVDEETPAEAPAVEVIEFAEQEQTEAVEPSIEDPAAEAFVAGLAKLSAGEVFADEKLKNTNGTVNAQAVVFATARITGEGELTKGDIISIAANIDGSIQTLYVKNARLSYLNADETAAYQNAKHDDGVEYRGVKLDGMDFSAAVTEEIEETTDEEPVTEEKVKEETPAEILDGATSAEPTEEVQGSDDVDDEELPTEPSTVDTESSEGEAEEQAEEKPDDVSPSKETEIIQTDDQEEVIEIPVNVERVIPETEEEIIEVEATQAVSEETEAGSVLYYAKIKLSSNKTINLRRKASTEDNDKVKMKETAANGELVAVLSEFLSGQDKWAQIRAKSGEGYIMMKFLEKVEDTEDVKKKDAVEEPQEDVDEPIEAVILIEETEESVEIETAEAVIEEVVEIDEIDEIVEVESAEAGSAVNITKQPQNQVISAYGKTVTFTIVAENATGYQWQAYTGSKWTNLTNVKVWVGNDSDSLSFKATEAYAAFQYRCIVTNSYGSIESDAAMYNVAPLPEIKTQPANTTAGKGQQVSFTIEAENADSYQWQALIGGKWTNLTNVRTWVGNNTETLSFKATEAYAAFQYRCIVTNSYGSVESDSATYDLAIIIDEVRYEFNADGTLTVAEYTGSSSNVVIPEVVQGATVTKIGEGAFEGNTNLQSIDLPDSITVIGKRAFANCSNLRNMN